jgi:hypothetical protein
LNVDSTAAGLLRLATREIRTTLHKDVFPMLVRSCFRLLLLLH